MSFMVAAAAGAGQISVWRMETYDTGIRYATGRWRIGAAVDMRYLNYFGNPASTDWETNLWINSLHDGGLLDGTGPQYFTAPAWISSIEAMANFDTCYRGRSYALVPDDTQQVGGNEVCTDPRPTVEIPPCDEDCKSPLVLSTRGDYRLTSARDGVQFDIDGDGSREQVAWTARDSDLAFVALDRNGNGRIDSGAELFGDSTLLANGQTAANGFIALAELDANSDGSVDAADPLWTQLLLWTDANHDGISTMAETQSVTSSRVTAIATAYEPSGRQDRHGNEFRYKRTFLRDGAWHKCYDVFLTSAQ
jgi:hypothetical protein